MKLEAIGIIDVWDRSIGANGAVIAQYEGLEIHEAMLSIPQLQEIIAALRNDVCYWRERALHCAEIEPEGT
jgi:hypothetical protein